MIIKKKLTAPPMLLMIALLAAFPRMAASQDNPDDLTAVSLESLMDIQVSSVSRHQSALRRTAAAAYVITQEDIRRSGATDIPDLLRMVPGVDVAQINSSIWAVSIRGFNGHYANKLQVLVDGRSVYDHAFSGVYWNLQNLILEDIERIEVIRGPGATMWGSNAVNGVISITTKKAALTQGGLVVADAGSNRPAEGSFRYGGAIGNNAFYRVYGTQTTRSSTTTASGDPGRDAWNMTRGGFRVDWNPSARDSFNFEGAVHRGVDGSPARSLVSLAPIEYRDGKLFRETGGHLLARWNHSLNGSDLTIQAYHDKRTHEGFMGRQVSVTDIDLQHSVAIGNRHNLVWGLSHREMRDEFENTVGVSFTPNRKRTALSSAFLQNEATIVPDKLFFTAGSKFERNSFTGYELQPSARMLWLPTSRQSLWVAASHAIRTVNRSDRGLRINATPIQMGRNLGLITILGQENTRSENLVGYEAGYRYQANRRLWLDVATFYNTYNHLTTLEPGATFFETDPTPAHVAIPFYFDNKMKGETYGAEIAANYKLTDFWSVKTSYSLLRMRLHKYADSKDAEAEKAEGENPANQFYVGSFLTLPKSIELSSHAYFTGQLPAFEIPRETRVDLNLAWKGIEDLEFSLVGQNLLGSRKEFGVTGGSQGHLIGRSIYARVTWEF